MSNVIDTLLSVSHVTGGGSGGGGGGEAVLINSKSISANGTYKASDDSGDGYKKVVVNVPNSYAAGDEGKVVSSGSLVSQSAHAEVTSNGTVDTTTNNSVTVNVANSYAAGDEGKVVSNGALVAQTAHAQVTSNGTIDTTLNNSVEVAVNPTLITKTFTENGTYSAEDDNADGYSSVTVNAAGGITIEVPDTYEQMEYIMSDGSAWIDTGCVWADDAKLELYGASPSGGQTGYWHPLGCNGVFIQINQPGLAPVGTATIMLNGGGNLTGKVVSLMKQCTILTPTSYSAYDFSQSFGAVVATSSGTVASGTKSIALFARQKDNGTVDYPARNYAIFRFKFYLNDVLTVDLVPAKRKADGVLGFYDVVGNTFLTNAGSGNLSGGALS